MSVNYSKYFQKKNDAIIFTGDTCELYIPKNYENYACLSIEKTVNTLGIFEMLINDNISAGLFLPLIIEVIPSEIDNIVIDNVEYAKLTLKKGDILLNNTKLIQNTGIAYTTFAEFVEKGKLPSFIGYDKTCFMFDIVRLTTGAKIPSEHTIYEILFSHLHRNSNDVTKPYRLSPKGEPTYLSLKDMSHATTTMTAKLIGGNLADSINTGLVNAADNSSKIENLLRQ